MNPTTFDRCPNLGELPYLSETGLIHVLRQRYGANRWFTWADAATESSVHHRHSCLLALHPLLPPGIAQQHAQAVYGERMLQAYHSNASKNQGAEHMTEPHIFAVAEAALQVRRARDIP